MYMDAVKDIQKLEEQMELVKAQARTRAQEDMSAAEKEGRGMLSAARLDVRRADEEALSGCEAEAEAHRQKVLSAAEADCSDLRARAQSHMKEAVERIVGRVVER